MSHVLDTLDSSVLIVVRFACRGLMHDLEAVAVPRATVLF